MSAIGDKNLDEFFDDTPDDLPEHLAPPAPVVDAAALERENAELRAELATMRSAKPPPPGERVMRTNKKADGTVEQVATGTRIGKLNPLTLLTPKDPAWYYRWVQKDRCAGLQATGWEYVHAKNALLAGIEGLPLDGIAQLHDLVCMRLPMDIYLERQNAVRARGVKARKKEAEKLRGRLESSGERIFGQGARRGLHGRS